ncbi:hypothetical protein TH53_25745 [Pedobacter lusitanus]|uniref:Uncharacterized protein n=2 Tax=Pedobacter lusitanus TaxID=1503925 RepID=A0A0D0FQ42_9SPHI|nr:hypothetical protein TH53_25745 [Pedobacter lusitanus]
MLGSCSNRERCTLNFNQYSNDDFLRLWNDETNRALLQKGDEKSIRLLDFEKKNNASVFSRKSFFEIFKEKEDNNNIQFSELSIFEILYTGEKNQSIKYLINSCGEESIIVKYSLGINGWIVSDKYKINIEKVEHLYKVLKEKDKEVYWGGNITEVACLTRIKGSNQVNVQVIESLNRLQFDAVLGLRAKD